MRIAVGSRNPAKIEGVRRAFVRVLGPVEVIPVDVTTSVGRQPVGLGHIVKGAVERAVAALRNTGGDYGVGVEAGLLEVPGSLTGYLVFQACAIVDPEERLSLGFGPGFEFPADAVNAVFSGAASELEEPMEKITRIKQVGDRGGAIGWLTRGLVSRADITEIAVIMALVPRINPSLYPLRRVDEVLRELHQA